MKQRTPLPRKRLTPRRKALWVQIEEEKRQCISVQTAEEIAVASEARSTSKTVFASANFKAKSKQMKENVNFRDPRSHITAHGRYRLKGEDYEALRRRKYEAAGGKCERKIQDGTTWTDIYLCNRPAPWSGSVFTRGHLAHKSHGPRKTDTVKGTLWSCADCHFREHGPQFRKERMSRALTAEQFVNYYAGEHCLCQNDKPERSALCAGCREVLASTNPALLHVIENGTDEPLYQALGEFRDLVRKAIE